MTDQPSSSGDSGQRQADFNPYAAPAHATLPIALPPAGDNEAIRRMYLSAEANIRSLGSLYCLAAIFLGIAFVMNVYSFVVKSPFSISTEVTWSMFLMAGTAFLFFVVYAGTGIGLRRLKVWSRWVATVFSVLGLLAFPIGTVFAVLFLFVLWSKKASYVFQPDYQRVIAATPHIKYRTSIVIWILLGILLFVIGAAFVSMVV